MKTEAGQSGEVNIVTLERAPPLGPRLRAPGRKLLWGRAGVGGRAAASEEGIEASFRGLVRPPSFVLPHKGGGYRLRPIAWKKRQLLISSGRGIAMML